MPWKKVEKPSMIVGFSSPTVYPRLHELKIAEEGKNN
jgi:hypothetical protein